MAMYHADLALRDNLIREKKLGDGYHKDMKALHLSNANQLESILDEIGFPTADKVGREAYEAAWMIAQHSIGSPKFMRKFAQLLAEAVENQKADKKLLAYLNDRIAVLEGKPQQFGTQFDWDENGELSPNLMDNVSLVNERRATLGMNSIEEQTQSIRERSKLEHQRPPKDATKRKKEMDEWRRAVGWLD
ncbi:MAG: hypothetical protein KDC49_17150 [Saprospiraceae bacterium]|nr:hypothetical protein [Saprospiraceae bacterium]